MGNHTKKAVQELDNYQSKINKGLKRIQYSCDHQKRPLTPALKIISDNKKTDAQGNSTSCYKCEKCRALISAKAPTNEEAEEAFATILTMSNYMRLQTDGSTEKGKDKLQWHADFMMHAEDFFKSYKALRNEAVKKNENKSRSDGKHGGAFYEG